MEVAVWPQKTLKDVGATERDNWNAMHTTYSNATATEFAVRFGGWCREGFGNLLSFLQGEQIPGRSVMSGGIHG